MTTIDLPDLFERSRIALGIMQRANQSHKPIVAELNHFLKFQGKQDRLEGFDDWLNYLLEQVREIEAMDFERQPRPSEHIGTIGERRPFSVQISFVKTFPYQVEGFDFERHLTVCHDQDGNVVTYWNKFNLPDPTEEFPKNKRPAVAGEKISFSAKVLTHNNYKGTKQTQIQRPTKIQLA